MYAYIEERVLNVAEYIVEHSATVRSAAREFGISKSTVHHDMQTRLKNLDPVLAKQVRAILTKNREERHIRGGMATYLKYKGIPTKNELDKRTVIL
jgi:putative DeoR family transcriptional regulator (stage III sporulation protein D)